MLKRSTIKSIQPIVRKKVPGSHDPYEHPPGRVQTIFPPLAIIVARITFKNLQLMIQPRKFPPRPLAAAATAAIVECARPRRAACCHADMLPLVINTATDSSRFLHAHYLHHQSPRSRVRAATQHDVPPPLHMPWRPCGFSRNVQTCFPSLRDNAQICYLHHYIPP